jgi:hypothetical protein
MTRLAVYAVLAVAVLMLAAVALGRAIDHELAVCASQPTCLESTP